MDSLDYKFAALHEAGHAVTAIALGVPSVRATFSWNSVNIGVIERYRAGQEVGNLEARGKMVFAAICFAGVVAERIMVQSYKRREFALELAWDETVIPINDLRGIYPLSFQEREDAILNSLNILERHLEAVRGIAYLLLHSKESCVVVTSSHLDGRADGAKLTWPGLLSLDEK